MIAKHTKEGKRKPIKVTDDMIDKAFKAIKKS